MSALALNSNHVKKSWLGIRRYAKLKKLITPARDVCPRTVATNEEPKIMLGRQSFTMSKALRNHKKKRSIDMTNLVFCSSLSEVAKLLY